MNNVKIKMVNKIKMFKYVLGICIDSNWKSELYSTSCKIYR